MKKFFAIFGQLVLFAVFLGLFCFGSFLDLALMLVLHKIVFHSPHWFVSATGYFVPTGLLLMTGLFVIVLAIEAASRRIRTAGLWTSVAFVVALVIGVVAHFGWVHPS